MLLAAVPVGAQTTTGFVLSVLEVKSYKYATIAFVKKDFPTPASPETNT